MVLDIIKLRVYVIHHKALANRKSLCDKLQQDLTSRATNFDLVSFDYITRNDPGEPFDSINVDIQPIPNDGSGLDRLNAFLRPLKIAHVSNALKHKVALEMIASNATTGTETIHLVLEDDALKQSMDNSFLEKAIHTFVSSKVPVMFLGMPPGVGAKDGLQPVSEVYTALPCCDSYLITHSAARLTLDHFSTLKFSTNIQLMFAFAKANITPYMSAPAVFVDGSKLGVFMSTIDSNNRLVFNGGYVAIAKAMNETDAPSEDKIESLFDKAEPKWHPEYMHLRALYEQKRGNYKAAEQCFTEALNQYVALGGIVDNQTELIRDFMRLYRHLQPSP